MPFASVESVAVDKRLERTARRFNGGRTHSCSTPWARRCTCGGSLSFSVASGADSDGESDILAEYIRPDERSFGIVIAGRMSDDLKDECRRMAPDYHETLPGNRRIHPRWLTPVYSDEL